MLLLSSFFHRLFKQYLLLLLVNQMAAALFRFIAALGRTMVVANTLASFALLVLLVLSGFILSHRNSFEQINHYVKIQNSG